MKNLKAVHFLLSFSSSARMAHAVHKSEILRICDVFFRSIGAIIAGIRGLLAGLQPQPKLVPILVYVAASQSDRRTNTRRHG